HSIKFVMKHKNPKKVKEVTFYNDPPKIYKISGKVKDFPFSVITIDAEDFGKLNYNLDPWPIAKQLFEWSELPDEAKEKAIPLDLLPNEKNKKIGMGVKIERRNSSRSETGEESFYSEGEGRPRGYTVIEQSSTDLEQSFTDLLD